MASASSKSAKSLFADSKKRLSDRVEININNTASVVRQIQRGSKTNEIMNQTIKTFVTNENSIESSYNNLQNIQKIIQKLNEQRVSIEKNVYLIENLKEEITAMQR